MSLSQSQKGNRRGEKETPYALNKKAFDTVMLYFRRMDRPLLKPLGAIDPESSNGPTYRNPIKPLPLELWCDIWLAIRAAMPRGIQLSDFLLAYLLFDSEDETERNMFSSRVLGGRSHSVEQRLGAEFIRRSIWPVSVYLNPPRPGYKKFRSQIQH